MIFNFYLKFYFVGYQYVVLLQLYLAPAPVWVVPHASEVTVWQGKLYYPLMAMWHGERHVVCGLPWGHPGLSGATSITSLCTRTCLNSLTGYRQAVMVIWLHLP